MLPRARFTKTVCTLQNPHREMLCTPVILLSLIFNCFILRTEEKLYSIIFCFYCIGSEVQHFYSDLCFPPLCTLFQKERKIYEISIIMSERRPSKRAHLQPNLRRQPCLEDLPGGQDPSHLMQISTSLTEGRRNHERADL